MFIAKVFSHPNTPKSVLLIALTRGVSGFRIQIMDCFGIETNWRISDLACRYDMPDKEDILELAYLHTKYSMGWTGRN